VDNLVGFGEFGGERTGHTGLPMSLYDTIAASHRGQCFALMARRFRIDEVQVADVIYATLRELTASLDEAICDRGRLCSFLTDLAQGDYLRVLVDDAVFSDQVLRDRGQRLVANLEGARAIDFAELEDCAYGTGVTAATARSMLPYVCVLMMAAIRHKAERPLRYVLAARRGERHVAANIDPFQALADGLAATPTVARAQPPVGIVETLFGRSPRPQRPLPIAAE
jgi:hypothetical protein